MHSNIWTHLHIKEKQTILLPLKPSGSLHFTIFHLFTYWKGTIDVLSDLTTTLTLAFRRTPFKRISRAYNLSGGLLIHTRFDDIDLHSRSQNHILRFFFFFLDFCLVQLLQSVHCGYVHWRDQAQYAFCDNSLVFNRHFSFRFCIWMYVAWPFALPDNSCVFFCCFLVVVFFIRV